MQAASVAIWLIDLSDIKEYLKTGRRIDTQTAWRIFEFIHYLCRPCIPLLCTITISQRGEPALQEAACSLLANAVLDRPVIRVGKE